MALGLFLSNFFRDKLYMFLNDILSLGNICTSPLFRNVCEISSSYLMDVEGCVRINTNLFVAPIWKPILISVSWKWKIAGLAPLAVCNENTMENVANPSKVQGTISTKDRISTICLPEATPKHNLCHTILGNIQFFKVSHSNLKWVSIGGIQ